MLVTHSKQRRATILILQIVWEAGKPLISRMLDGVEPEIVEEIRQVVSSVEKVSEVTEVKVRWLRHRLYRK